MEQLRLVTGGRETTRLGYGCSSLMAGIGRRQSLRLLDTAYDAGVRHFDVAPLYGYGEAERCLGDLLARHGDITVATKFGLASPERSGMLRAARRLAEPLLQRIPALKRAARSASAAAAAPPRSDFSVQEARTSLENSLRLLRTDHIDIFLLHEVESADLTGNTLLRFLEHSTTNGTVGIFGVASDTAKIASLQRERPGYCRVLQHGWSVFDPLEPQQTVLHIHYSAVAAAFQTLRHSLIADKARCRRWSEITGRDLERREQLAALILKAALVLHPNTILLVSSKNHAHIKENVRVAEDVSLEAPARRLYDLVQREGLASAANQPPEGRR